MKGFYRISRLPPYVFGIVRDLLIGSVDFSQFLLREGKTAASSGVGIGKYGGGCMRFALRENEHRIKHAVKGIRSLLYSSKKK